MFLTTIQKKTIIPKQKNVLLQYKVTRGNTVELIFKIVYKINNALQILTHFSNI